jgi:predicted metal-dependent phosphoesterase TrpH
MRLDLHVHSVYSSDGKASPREIVMHARRFGIDGLSITDHNSVASSKAALAEKGELEGLVYVRGVEVSALEGHILAYGVDEPIPRGLTATEVVERAGALGGIAVVAHPYRFWSGVGEKVARTLKCQALEGVNSRSNKGDNVRARELGKSLNLPMTGGSDAHDIDYLGLGTTVFDDKLESEDQVIDAIVKGLCYPEGGNRSSIGAIKYAAKNLAGWLGRGMRRM